MDILEEIKNRVSMLEVLEMYGQYPVRGRNNYRCFAHSPDKNPSAGLTKDGDKFHCFSCGWTGNVFDVVQHFNKCDVKTAMRFLDDKFRLGLYQELSQREKLQIARELKERERQKQEKLEWDRFEKSVLSEVAKDLHAYEEMEIDFRIKKGEYRHEWGENCGSAYFFIIQRIDWLDWLFNMLCELDHPECMYDYIYPKTKREILKLIKDGEISIQAQILP